jgi:hypothetical protein
LGRCERSEAVLEFLINEKKGRNSAECREQHVFTHRASFFAFSSSSSTVILTKHAKEINVAASVFVLIDTLSKEGIARVENKMR